MSFIRYASLVKTAVQFLMWSRQHLSLKQNVDVYNVLTMLDRNHRKAKNQASHHACSVGLELQYDGGACNLNYAPSIRSIWHFLTIMKRSSCLAKSSIDLPVKLPDY